MSETFEAIAGIVGKRMDEAWAKIMSDLADVATGKKAVSDIHHLTGSGEAMLTQQLLVDFFAQLGGASLNIDFSSRVAKGQVAEFSAYKLDLQGATPAPLLGFEGSITIGGTIRF